MLLMATSMGASLLQLPIVGWFTQIAALGAAVLRAGVAPSALDLPVDSSMPLTQITA